MIKQFFHFEKGTSDSYEIPPAAVLLHPLRSFRKTSTCAEMTVIRSHRGYNPRVLRMTVGVGFVVTLSEAGVE